VVVVIEDGEVVLPLHSESGHDQTPQDIRNDL
jgi:hypothetical protein